MEGAGVKNPGGGVRAPSLSRIHTHEIFPKAKIIYSVGSVYCTVMYCNAYTVHTVYSSTNPMTFGL